jgi:citronellol/citronellal dehydrogenase
MPTPLNRPGKPRDAGAFTGRFCIDEDVLREAGVTDFTGYAVDPRQKLLADLFLE